MPAGALAAPTELYLEQVAEAPLTTEGLAVLGPIFTAGPLDAGLMLPATVSARFDGDQHRAALFVEQDGEFERLGGRIIADQVEGRVLQLGTLWWMVSITHSTSTEIVLYYRQSRVGPKTLAPSLVFHRR